MKKLLLIVFICVPLWSAQADNQRTKERIRHIRTLVARQKGELNDTKIKLELSLTEIARAEDQIKAVAKERDQWQAYGVDQHDRLKSAETKIASTKAAILRRDIIIGLLVLSIGVYAFLKFYLRIPFL